MRIPLSAPDMTETEIAAVAAVLRGTQLSLGPKLGEFERAMAACAGVEHAVAVSSGTAGLHLCVRALGIGPGEEVLVPSFTFIAAANVVRYEGARPVFVEIEPDSLNLDPEALERAVTPRTRAIMAVHTFGRPAAMNRIGAVARKHGLVVIEDACEAIGAVYGGRPVGSFGAAGVFAFYPNKQITTGEGGCVVTRDAALAERMRGLRNQGRMRAAGPGAGSGEEAGSEADAWFEHAELGFNYRLSEMACALGVEQARRLGEILARREAVARGYACHLADEPELVLPALELPGGRISWFVYVVRLRAAGLGDADAARLRDAVVSELRGRGIGCGRYFAPVHLQPCYSEWRPGARLPVTEAQACRTIALPFFNRMSEDQVAEVCECLRAALGRRGR